MRVIRLHELGAAERDAALREAALGREVTACGVAEFAPGVRAHDGERHVHPHDEVFIILAGEIAVPIAGGPTEVARAGDIVVVAAGEEHHLTNNSTVPCVAAYLILRRLRE